jgi:hypothetical protein
MGGGRRGGVLRLQGGSHEEIVPVLSLQAGASKIYRDGGSSVIRLNNIARQTGASLYFDQERIAKVDNANLNGILGGWAIIRDARQDAFLVIPGTVSRSFTADPATATLTTPLNEAVHYLAAGVPVRFATTGELPAGLTADTTYYVIDATARSFRVSATPFGEAVQIASTGTGTHTVETFGALRRPGPASLVFTADPRGRAGAAGNNAIRVRITHNAGSFGPITFSFSGSGTTAVPWSFTINTTGAASSASEIADALSIYANAIGRLKVVSSGSDFSPDSTVYPAAPATWMLLDGGVDDTGRQSLSWARNGSTVPGSFNDGPVESANDFQTNNWSSPPPTPCASPTPSPPPSTCRARSVTPCRPVPSWCRPPSAATIPSSPAPAPSPPTTRASCRTSSSISTTSWATSSSTYRWWIASRSAAAVT